MVHLAYPISIWLFNEMHGSITMYYVVSFLTNAYSTFSVAIASVADNVSPANRATAFAILMAVASGGFVISAGFSPELSNVSASGCQMRQLHFISVLGSNYSCCRWVVCFEVVVGDLRLGGNAVRVQTCVTVDILQPITRHEDFAPHYAVSEIEFNRFCQQCCLLGLLGHRILLLQCKESKKYCMTR